MIKLEKGAPVKVRLRTGEVVEAVYDKHLINKTHKVSFCDRPYYAVTWALKSRARFWAPHECRFVGNPCVLVPVGVSV